MPEQKNIRIVRNNVPPDSTMTVRVVPADAYPDDALGHVLEDLTLAPQFEVVKATCAETGDSLWPRSDVKIAPRQTIRIEARNNAKEATSLWLDVVVEAVKQTVAEKPATAPENFSDEDLKPDDDDLASEPVLTLLDKCLRWFDDGYRRALEDQVKNQVHQRPEHLRSSIRRLVSGLADLTTAGARYLDTMSDLFGRGNDPKTAKDPIPSAGSDGATSSKASQ